MAEKDNQLTHVMRPGPIWGTQILCEDPSALKRGDYVAELSARGSSTVDCQSCLMVVREIVKIAHYLGVTAANVNLDPDEQDRSE